MYNSGGSTVSTFSFSPRRKSFLFLFFKHKIRMQLFQLQHVLYFFISPEPFLILFFWMHVRNLNLCSKKYIYIFFNSAYISILIWAKYKIMILSCHFFCSHKNINSRQTAGLCFFSFSHLYLWTLMKWVN